MTEYKCECGHEVYTSGGVPEEICWSDGHICSFADVDDKKYHDEVNDEAVNRSKKNV